jgi:uncharacterized membrane protein YczE
VTGSALLLLASGAPSAVVGAIVFTLFLARGCPETPRPRAIPWIIWYVLVAILFALYLYAKLAPLPHDVRMLILSADGGYALAGMGFVIASDTPGACAFIDAVLERTIFAKSRGYRRFVYRMGYWYMIIALIAYPLIFTITTPPITIENVVYILITTGFFLGVAVWADVFTLALGIYLKQRRLKNAR